MRGLPFPRTASGRASLLPPVPWHYSGDLLTVEYRTDPSAIANLLPDGVTLAHEDEDPGAVAFIWADWQSCGDDGEELLDPVRSQYKEAFVPQLPLNVLYTASASVWPERPYTPMLTGDVQSSQLKFSGVPSGRLPVQTGVSCRRMPNSSRSMAF